MKVVLILFIAFWGVCDGRGRGRGNEFYFLNFARHLENQILVDAAGNLSQVSTQDEMSCSVKCLKHTKCTSYNFGPIGDPRSQCELLDSSRFVPGTTLQNKAGFVHGSLSTPCEQNPCAHGAQCLPLYESDDHSCNCTGSGFIGDRCDQTDCGVVFDFENGVADWTRTGSAFDNQPTYGDNSAARGAGPSNLVGDWFIGTFEHRPSSGTSPGQQQGDAPAGTLTSPPFEIKAKTLLYRVGGSSNSNDVRVELLVDGVVVYTAVGKMSEAMEERQWDVSAHRGKMAKLNLVDASSGDWGHINFDHLAYACP